MCTPMSYAGSAPVREYGFADGFSWIILFWRSGEKIVKLEILVWNSDEMSLKIPLPQGLSFLRSVGWLEDRKVDSASKQQLSPTLKLQTDKEVYRPGDSVTVTIEIHSPASLKDDAGQTVSGEDASSLLLDALSFELKGIEKLDSQWFSVPKPLPGSKQRRGTL